MKTDLKDLRMIVDYYEKIINFVGSLKTKNNSAANDEMDEIIDDLALTKISMQEKLYNQDVSSDK